MDTNQVLAEIIMSMLVDKYPDKVRTYEEGDSEDLYPQAEVDEAKEAALWTLKAVADMGYRIKRKETSAASAE